MCEPRFHGVRLCLRLQIHYTLLAPSDPLLVSLIGRSSCECKPVCCAEKPAREVEDSMALIFLGVQKLPPSCEDAGASNIGLEDRLGLPDQVLAVN